MQPHSSVEPIYIDSNESLSVYCKLWNQKPVLALDTEFIRTDTYYPIGALIQVSDGEQCFLIDPLIIDDFVGFKSLLSNPNIIKVLHSCSEDLEVFYRLFNIIPSPIFDTQIAAGMDGYGFSLGYQRLTETLLDIHVPKGETRSNWLQRPLTDSQIHYAALDVEYLPKMYHMLKNSLESKGRLDWLQQDCSKMTNSFSDLGGISDYYKKVKSVWKLSTSQLAVLRHITQWREYKARELDKPRGRVLKDSSCFEIARLLPNSYESLSKIDDMNRRLLKDKGKELLALIQTAQSISKDEYPEPIPRPLPPENGSVLKRLKAHVLKRAEELKMAPELLVKKRDYEALLRSGYESQQYQLPLSLTDWRRDVIGNDLLHLLHTKK